MIDISILPCTWFLYKSQYDKNYGMMMQTMNMAGIVVN